MSFFEQPLDDATVNGFFAAMRWAAENARSCGAYHPIDEVVLGAGPDMADLARALYVWTKRKRLTSKERNANLQRVSTAYLKLADALETLRADRDYVHGEALQIDPENFRRSAEAYGPTGLRGKGGKKNQAWAFAALVSIQAQAYEQETGLPATVPSINECVRAEIEKIDRKIDRVQSERALRARINTALKRRRRDIFARGRSTSKNAKSGVC